MSLHWPMRWVALRRIARKRHTCAVPAGSSAKLSVVTERSAIATGTQPFPVRGVRLDLHQLRAAARAAQ